MDDFKVVGGEDGQWGVEPHNSGQSLTANQVRLCNFLYAQGIVASNEEANRVVVMLGPDRSSALMGELMEALNALEQVARDEGAILKKPPSLQGHYFAFMTATGFVLNEKGEFIRLQQ